MKKAIIAACLVAGFLLTAAALWMLRGEEQEPASQPTRAAPGPPARGTITVAEQRVPTFEEATGTVQPLQQAELAAKVMGRVVAVSVREGQGVAAGQTVVTLEAADLAAQVSQAHAGVKSAQARVAQARTAHGMQTTQSDAEIQQARAAVAAAEAQLAKVKTGPRQQEKEQAVQQVALARAGLQAAKDRLALVREGARRQEKAQAAQAVVAAQAALRTAELDLNRSKSLFQQEVIPKQRLDHAQMQYDVAKAQLEQAQQQQSLVDEGARTQEIAMAEQQVKQAEAQLQQAQQAEAMAQEGGREEDIAAAAAGLQQAKEALRNAEAARARDQLRQDEVRMAEAGVSQAQAGLRSADVMLSYSQVKAPFPGLVTARLADPGDMAAPGVPLVKIEDPSRYRLECTVPERLSKYVRLGAGVKVVLDALGPGELDGRVDEIVPAADPTTHTLTVKVGLPRRAGVKTGLFGRMRIETGRKRALLVPATAVRNENGITSVVAVARDGSAHERLVKVGKRYGRRLEILSGLDPGTTIALHPPDPAPEAGPLPGEAAPPSARPPGRQEH